MGFVIFYCLVIVRSIRNFNRAYAEVSERLCTLIERKLELYQNHEAVAISDQRQVDASISGDELFNRLPDSELNVPLDVTSSQNDRQTQISRGKILVCDLGAKTGAVTVRYCKSDPEDCSSEDEEGDSNCAAVKDHFAFVDFDKLPYDKVKAKWNLNVDSASSFKVFKPKNEVKAHKIENESISEACKESESEGSPSPHPEGHECFASENEKDFPKLPNSELCEKSLDSPETRKKMPEHDTWNQLSFESSVKAPAEVFNDMVPESSDEVRKQTALGTSDYAVHGVEGFDFPSHESQKDMPLETPVQDRHEEMLLKYHAHEVCKKKFLNLPSPEVSKDVDSESEVFTHEIYKNSVLEHPYENNTDAGLESSVTKVVEGMEHESSAHKVFEGSDLESSVYNVSQHTDLEFPVQKVHEDVGLKSSAHEVLEEPELGCSTNRLPEDVEFEPPVHSFVGVIEPESPPSKMSQDTYLECSVPKVSEDTYCQFSVSKVHEDITLESSVHIVSEDTDREYLVQKVHEDIALESSVHNALEKSELECSTNRVSEDMELEPPVQSFIAVIGPESPLPKRSQDTEIESSVHKVPEDTDLEFPVQKVYEDTDLEFPVQKVNEDETSVGKVLEKPELECFTSRESEDMELEPPVYRFIVVTEPESPVPKVSEDTDLEFPSQKHYEDMAFDSSIHAPEDMELESPARKVSKSMELESPARKVLEDMKIEFSPGKVPEDMKFESLARQIPQDIGLKSLTTEISEHILNKSTTDLDDERTVLHKQFKCNLGRTRSKSLSETSSERIKSSELSSEEKLTDKKMEENFVEATLKNIELVAESLTDASKAHLKQVIENTSYNLPCTDKKAYVLGSEFLTTALEECQVLNLLPGYESPAFMKSDLENLNLLIDELKSMQISHCNQTENSSQQDDSTVINNGAQENNLVSSDNQSVTSPSNKAVEKNAYLMSKCSEKETQTPLDEWKPFCLKPKNSPIIPCDRSSFYEQICVVFNQNIQGQSSNSEANSSNFRRNNPKRLRPPSPPPKYDESERYFVSLRLGSSEIKNPSTIAISKNKNNSTIDNNPLKNAILSTLNINKPDVENASAQTANINPREVAEKAGVNTGDVEMVDIGKVTKKKAVNSRKMAETGGAVSTGRDIAGGAVSTGRDIERQDPQRNQILENSAQSAEGANDTSKVELDEVKVSDQQVKKRKRSKGKGNKKYFPPPRQ